MLYAVARKLPTKLSTEKSCLPVTLPAGSHVIHIAVHTPLHSQVGSLLSYTHDRPLPAGTVVRVPLGQRELMGVAWAAPHAAAPPAGVVLRPVAEVLDALPPLDTAWQRLVAFAARYYQRSVGEIVHTALPPALRKLTGAQLARRLQARKKPLPATPENENPVALTTEQAGVCQHIAQNPGPFLLYGSTGSGKTEVYLHRVAQALEADPQAQALVLVPEINLTPQLLARFERRFAPRFGPQAVVSLHSGLTEAQRLKHWLAAHTGQARIVLGTRMAVLASLPGLKIIVVDEEHDPSFKQEEGARYSARDLAVWRGRDAGAKVILGSATPSLESWYACQQGRYQRLDMPSRVAAAALPAVHLVDLRQQPKSTVFAPALLQAITERIQRGEQSLVLLNRRGFAPVLWCGDCGWKSDCPHCSAHQVFHKGERRLRCHHCSASQAVPRRCPQCGNPDILALGQGTEQLQEALAQQLRNVLRPDGQPARIARMDADTTQGAGQLQEQLAQIHDGSVDVLVGTQMVAKGHDFRRMTLVAAVAPDAALMSSDFRAPERLFALLMQAAGRAGRDAAFMRQQGSQAQMWIQTHQAEHALYQALQHHDYPGFARQQLQERQQAGMPPFVFQALVRSDAKTQDDAQKFLHAAAQQARQLPALAGVFIYPPIPLAMQRVANVERAQMLIEAPSRSALQKFLHAWQPLLHQVRQQHRAVVRWLIDVDPQNL
ncbi:primosomal protein N' [uncultured Comamonas sp.]|nr:primosomal protein N' [uncultured Comamonas sp.]